MTKIFQIVIVLCRVNGASEVKRIVETQEEEEKDRSDKEVLAEVAHVVRVSQCYN